MNQVQSEQLARHLAAIADAKKAEDIIVLDMRELTTFKYVARGDGQVRE